MPRLSLPRTRLPPALSGKQAGRQTDWLCALWTFSRLFANALGASALWGPIHEAVNSIDPNPKLWLGTCRRKPLSLPHLPLACWAGQLAIDEEELLPAHLMCHQCISKCLQTLHSPLTVMVAGRERGESRAKGGRQRLKGRLTQDTRLAGPNSLNIKWSVHVNFLFNCRADFYGADEAGKAVGREGKRGRGGAALITCKHGQSQSHVGPITAHMHFPWQRRDAKRRGV